MGASPTPRTPKGWTGIATSTITVSIIERPKLVDMRGATIAEELGAQVTPGQILFAQGGKWEVINGDDRSDAGVRFGRAGVYGLDSGVGTAQNFRLQQSTESYVCPELSLAGYFIYAAGPNWAFANDVGFNLGNTYVCSHRLGTSTSFVRQP